MTTNMDFLKTRKGEEGFHASRSMFCIKDGKVITAPKDIPLSHGEWFEEEGWLTLKNREKFLTETIRGFYSASDNTLYCYRGMGFQFDNSVIKEILAKKSELTKKLSLPASARICFGPKDRSVHGTAYEQLCFENFEEVLEKGK